MKKVFFSFAIATVMASLVACGGKTEQNQEGQDSTAVEAEAKVTGEIKDCGAFTVVVPEGWKFQNPYENCAKFEFPGETEALTRTFTINARPKPSPTATVVGIQRKFDSRVKNDGGGWQWEAHEDMTLGTNTWKVAVRKANETEEKAQWWFGVDMPDGGTCEVNGNFGAGDEDNDIIAILKTVEFK